VHHADIATVRETAITATLATAVGRQALSGGSAKAQGKPKARPIKATASRTARTPGETP
jgi:hypothetical protein